MDEKEEHVIGLIHRNLFVYVRKESMRDFKQRVLFVRQIVNKEKQVEVLEQKILNMQVQVLNLCTQYTYFLEVLHFKIFQ